MLRKRRIRTALARTLRSASPDAEKRMWWRLRNCQLNGLKFRRQYPIGPYVADFVCLEAGLVIELDGGQHQERAAQDEDRTAYLEKEGFRVLRYWDDQVLKQTDEVLSDILAVLSGSGSS